MNAPVDAAPERLLWLDLETTSLDERRGEVLEVCWFDVPLEGPWPLSPAPTPVVVQPSDPCHWDKAAREMHAASGLYELARASTIQLVDVEEYILDELVDGWTYYLAGSSIHFDRRWIRLQMPKLDRRLHYRMLDMSALLLFERALGREAQSRAVKPHRATEDVLASYGHFLRLEQRTSWSELSPAIVGPLAAAVRKHLEAPAQSELESEALDDMIATIEPVEAALGVRSPAAPIQDARRAYEAPTITELERDPSCPICGGDILCVSEGGEGDEDDDKPAIVCVNGHRVTIEVSTLHRLVALFESEGAVMVEVEEPDTTAPSLIHTCGVTVDNGTCEACAADEVRP